MLEVPMYRANGTRVQLVDLLAMVPANDWTWSILEFDGVGQMPANESVLEFQKKVREQPCGLILTWSEISRFAETVEYTIDCLIVAVSRIERLDVNKLLADDFQECEVAIRAIDSTEWILSASNRALLDGMERVALEDAKSA
jgi:hypothetical protein